MTFFEEELKKIMAESAILKDQRYVGRICYGTIGEDLRARIEFVTLGISNQYAGLKASIFNRKEGVVDSVLLRFMDVWGKQKVGNPNFREGVEPHIWAVIRYGLLRFRFVLSGADILLSSAILQYNGNKGSRCLEGF